MICLSPYTAWEGDGQGAALNECDSCESSGIMPAVFALASRSWSSGEGICAITNLNIYKCSLSWFSYNSGGSGGGWAAYHSYSRATQYCFAHASYTPWQSPGTCSSKSTYTAWEGLGELLRSMSVTVVRHHACWRGQCLPWLMGVEVLVKWGAFVP